MTRIIVYTVITDEHDNLRPCDHLGLAHFICFTDRIRQVWAWEPHPCPVVSADPRLNSRVPKILPHLCFDADYSIYIDGCFRLLIRPEEFVAEMKDADVGLFMHPARASVKDELNFCLDRGIGDRAYLLQTFARFDAKDEWPRALWAGGCIVRKHNERTAAFNEVWAREFFSGTGGGRDQFALAHAATVANVDGEYVKVHTFPGNILEDDRLEFMMHARFTNIKDNGTFEEENARWRERRKRILELTT